MPSTADDILTIAELSRHLRVHPTTIYRLLRQRRIPGFRVGTSWRFSRAAIERWQDLQVNGESTRAKVATRRRARRNRRKRAG